METDWDLEDWLLSTGEQVELKRIGQPDLPLSPRDRLLREIWIFDLEALNGGVSQYFCNRKLAQWISLKQAWLQRDVPSLGPIIAEVERIISGADDPYLATVDETSRIDEFYYSNRTQMIREIKRLFDGSPTS